MKAGFSQDCVDFKPDVFHQVINIVSMVLEQLYLVCFVQFNALAQLSGLSFLNQASFIGFNLRPDRIVLNSSIKPCLPLVHLVRLSCEHLRPLSYLRSLLSLPILYLGLILFDLLLELPLALLLPFCLILEMALTFFISRVFELSGLASDLFSVLLLLHLFYHGGLLLAELLLPPNLLNNLHLALILVSLLF